MAPKGRLSKRGNTKRATTRRTKKKAPRRTVNQAVKQYVARAFANRLEIKTASDPDGDFINEPLVRVSSALGALEQFQTPLQFPLDSITQGTGQDERVGNTITLKSWILKIYFTPSITPAPSNITSPQLRVRFFIGYRKDYQPIASPPPALFQAGSSSYSPTGNFSDTMANINKDTYVILYRKTFNIGVAQPDATYAPFNGLANNNFPMTKSFVVNMCNHGFKNMKVKYNDASPAPQNAKINALTMWTVVVNASGQPITNSVVGVSSYDISFNSSVSYTDA